MEDDSVEMWVEKKAALKDGSMVERLAEMMAFVTDCLLVALTVCD